MLEEILLQAAAVDLDVACIDVLRRVVRCIDLEVLAVLKVNNCLLEQRRSDSVFIRSRAHRIESESREHIPC